MRFTAGRFCVPMVCQSAPQEPLQDGLGVRRSRNHRDMWQLTIVCSGCAEESELVVEDVEDVEREACECGYSFVVLSVAEFEPVEVAGAEVIELRRHEHKRLAA